MTCHEVGGAQLNHAGVIARAFLRARGATLLEIAVVGHVHRIGNVAGDVEQGVGVGVHGGLGLLQADGVGVLGIVEDLPHRALLDDPSCIHDHHVVGHLGHHAQIVGDEQDGAVDLGLQITEEIQDLRLNGHVQSRGGLVCDDEAGVAGQSHGDHDALAHTARQLVGVGLVDPLGGGDAHQLQHTEGSLLGGFLGGTGDVDEGDLVQLISDGEDGVEGGHGLLEDHGDLAASDAVYFVDGHIRNIVDLFLGLVADGAVGTLDRDGIALLVSLVVLRAKADAARYDLSRRPLDELHDRHTGHGFAAARLAHDAHRGVFGDVEGDAVDGSHHALVGVEVGVQVLDLKDVLGVLHFGDELALVGASVLASLQRLGDLAILLGDGADLLARQVMTVFGLVSHAVTSFPWDQAHLSDRRLRS